MARVIPLRLIRFGRGAFAKQVSAIKLEGGRLQTQLHWLVPVAAIIGVQAVFAFSLNAIVGQPASPPLAYYFLANASFLHIAVALFVLLTIARLSYRREDVSLRALLHAFYSNRDKLITAFIGIQLFTLSAAFMTWTKAMTPYAVGFRWDVWLADADRLMFGADPWVYVAPLIWLLEAPYAVWFAALLFTFVWLLLMKPSKHRDRALVAYFLTWGLGTLAPFLMPAAGPVFFERIGLGPRFAEMPLTEIFRFESDYLWAAYASGEASFAGGISAMPSMHVAMSLWIALAVRPLKWLFPLAIGFYAVIWVGSVATGWHYSLDGLAGSFVAVAAWLGSRANLRVLRRPPRTIGGAFALHTVCAPKLEPSEFGSSECPLSTHSCH